MRYNADLITFIFTRNSFFCTTFIIRRLQFYISWGAKRASFTKLIVMHEKYTKDS